MFQGPAVSPAVDPYLTAFTNIQTRQSPEDSLGRPSPTGENRFETGFRQDAFHLFAFVALDFDAAVFHGASDAAGFLHLFREFLFLRQTDSGEISRHGDTLAAAMRSLTDDVHPAAVGVLLPALRCLHRNDWSGTLRSFRSRRQITEPGQGTERIRRQTFSFAGGLVSFVSAHPDHSTTDPEKFTLFQ